MRDPRHFQIAALSALLLYGITVLRFDVSFWRAALIITTALATQWVCSKATQQRFDPRSALISALSLCLLLRSNHIGWLLLAAVIAVGSKFVIRVRGKHLFNPTNGAIVALMLITERIWVSPGQWGNAAFFAFLIACLGALVVNRAERGDVTWAFIVFWSGLLIGRSLYLGEPLTIPFHRLENGALLLFTFFMISDPKTTPDRRAGRILFAALVALGAYYIQFKLFRTNGLLWSLAAFSLLTPILDLLLPAKRYSWTQRQPAFAGGTAMPRTAAALTLIFSLLFATNASAFCGFYVAKGDAKLFNKASQVVLVRDGDRTVMTMANDFKGEPKEFAVVIPVPAVLQRGQIRIADKTLIDRIDAYSAPRLVEYYDEDPCHRVMYEYMTAPAAAPQRKDAEGARRAKSLGVTIEASYTVGEYDILILSATQSNGLETWLRENGYTIPDGAGPVLASYIKQNLKFFVAKVNLKEQSRLGFNYLRPIQVAYESPKFMLPIRLGTVNASGTQELFVYALTRKGRVETTNYRTVKLPSDVDVPLYVKDKFGDFYKALFSRQVSKHDMTAVFVEYAWDMRWCDPCAADPLTPAELSGLGVFWAKTEGGSDAFITRLHVRYDRAHFPEDLVFQETGDQQSFQARYVMHHAWTGKPECDEGKSYPAELRKRREQEAKNLAELTGWKVQDIRKTMNLAGDSGEKKWWEW
jgi:Na+-translocating ferredoxin:NAD+ oxidoreductase RnfD subunit